MGFSVEWSDRADGDLEAIFRHLIRCHLDLGDDIGEALVRAEERLARIRAAGSALARMPHRGTLERHLGPHVRHVTRERAIFYFEIDEAAGRVRLLAVFFSGQDHRRQIIDRLLAQTPDDA